MKKMTVNINYFNLVEVNEAFAATSVAVQRSLKIDNQHYRSYSLLGELLLAYGDYKGSLDNFISSLEINYNQKNHKYHI